MTNEPYREEDFADWNTYRNFIEQGVERMLAPQAHPGSSRNNTKEDFLKEIVSENIKASNERINYHE